jgi:hypothetical protein
MPKPNPKSIVVVNFSIKDGIRSAFSCTKADGTTDLDKEAIDRQFVSILRKRMMKLPTRPLSVLRH